MSRIRTVKPRLFKHVELFDAEKETGLPLRIAFAGLFTVADKEGRFQWSPRELKTDVLPYDEVDFARVLDALASRGFIRKYRVGGKWYGCFPSWKLHQVINNREADSFLPSPEEHETEEATQPASLPQPLRVGHASVTPLVHASGEGKGREGEREGVTPSLRSGESATSADMPDPPKSLDLNKPLNEAVSQWNALAGDLGLSKIERVTTQRRSAWNARFGNGHAEDWPRALDAIRASKFCRGDNTRGWRVDFDFLLAPAKLTRLLEGKYADREGAPKDSTGIDWDALRAKETHAA